MVVLDITAGNRHIWGGWMPDIKEAGPIIYCDIEWNLRIPAEVVCDNTRLPFREECAHAVVYDPPHWNFGSSWLHGDPQEKGRGSFWGNFKNLKTLRRLLAGGSKESARVLKNKGRLYFKWSDVRYPLSRMIVYFLWQFKEIARMERESKSGRGKKKSYWVTFEKSG